MEQSLIMDAWMREAEEAERLMEDIEIRVRNQQQVQHEDHCGAGDQRLRDGGARSKLLEVGIKLDRLESLLHNPPSKPVLTDQDLDVRWKMLSDMKLRTKAAAFSFFSMPSANRPGSIFAGDTKASFSTFNSYNQAHCSADQLKKAYSKGDSELLEPLVADETIESQVQMKMNNSSAPRSWLYKVCWGLMVLIGVVAVLVILVIVCATL